MKRFIKLLAPKLTHSSSLFLLTIIVLIATQLRVVAQQYVSSTTATLNPDIVPVVNIGAGASIDDKDDAAGAPDGLSARINVEGLVVDLGLTEVEVSSDARLNMTFSPAIAAGITTYVRINDIDTDVLGLDLGELVGVLGLLENNIITVRVNGTPSSGTLVRNAAGERFLAVTPSVSLTTLSVGLDFDEVATVGLGQLSMEIEYAVAYTNTAFTPCSSILSFTNIDAEPSPGVTLTLDEALQNPERAIDGDISSSNYSELKNGNVGVITTVSQVIYLTKTVPGTTEVVATVSKPALLLDLDVLAGITFQAYLNDAPVGIVKTVESAILSLDLLDFFEASNLVSFAFTPTTAPGATYNRIVITSTGIASVFSGIRVHEVAARTPVTFVGGKLTNGTVGENYTGTNLNSAALIPAEAVNYPGFGITCGVQGDYTFALYEVTPSGRTLAGSLPPSLTLNSSGVFSGTPTAGQDGTFTFDVIAINAFGQFDIASFILTIDPSLPVTLVRFEAKPEGRTSSLSWATTMETNSDRFEIERSQTGKNWQKIGTVRSNQESTSLLNYSFTDGQPLDGSNLYRLKMVDLDETFAYSQIKNVDFAASAYLYPNPVIGNENLIINAMDWSSIKQVKVINAMGKTVFEASNALSTGINTKNLAAGAYFVKMIHVNGSVSTHKFVRQ